MKHKSDFPPANSFSLTVCGKRHQDYICEDYTGYVRFRAERTLTMLAHSSRPARLEYRTRMETEVEIYICKQNTGTKRKRMFRSLKQKVVSVAS